MDIEIRTFALRGIEATPATVRIGTGGTVDGRHLDICRNAGFSVNERFRPAQTSLSAAAQAVVKQGDLASVELPKQADFFGLPISLGILAASGQLIPKKFHQCGVVG